MKKAELYKGDEKLLKQNQDTFIDGCSKYYQFEDNNTISACGFYIDAMSDNKIGYCLPYDNCVLPPPPTKTPAPEPTPAWPTPQPK